MPRSSSPPPCVPIWSGDGVDTREPITCQEAEPFALRVTDDSMAPEFPAGCIVIVDPTGVVRHGAYVIAETAAGLTFRELRIEGGKMSLHALDARHETIELVRGLESIKGVVVQRAGRRRREHKRYD